MKCEDALDCLDDHVDGSLSRAETREVERHLRECARCAQEERGLRSLLAEAAGLPAQREPGRDLWPEIAERIREGRVVPLTPPRAWWFSDRPMLLAAAAVALVALSSAVTVEVLRSRPPAPATAARTTPGPMTPTTAGPDADLRPAAVDLAATSYENAEAEYVRAADSLEAAIRGRQSVLNPETVAVVEKNLKVINEALEQVRAALREDPGNRELLRMLVATHQKKVAVLRRVVKFTT